MNWVTVAALIAQYGLPFAQKVWTKWQSGNPPTEADWIELNGLANQTAKDRMLAALARAGIDPNSDQGKALLNAA